MSTPPAADPDPITTVSEGESREATSSPPLQQPIDFTYSCRKCRVVLFREDELVPHSTEKDSKGNKMFRKTWAESQQAGSCTSYFLDPDRTPWVAEESREAAVMGLEVAPDTIYCPNVKCHAKIGTQSWVGTQCSCGSWVTPAFKILGKAVDKMPVYE